ncbi:hypothetical protein F5Y07DRAFT_362756 [Xylaria sp. FL0933]|nr:hypothetical protein F5Y07DRAFT_362756 [Xylaria sp. FL0933]
MVFGLLYSLTIVHRFSTLFPQHYPSTSVDNSAWISTRSIFADSGKLVGTPHLDVPCFDGPWLRSRAEPRSGAPCTHGSKLTSMPPIQNTFCIIPDAPSAINANHHGGGGGDSASARLGRPPMTTKQVKKAYQKANKGPKLSKAEQRRQELFEQDRIRKEFEKEKNQARARAARDKKREKEERERAERKKKGLPLVDVRASQDTIARFVRAKPKSQRGPSASPSLVVGGCEEEKGCSSASPRHDDSGVSGQTRQLDDSNKENVKPHDDFESHSTRCDGLSIIDHAEPLIKKRKIDVLEAEEEGHETPFFTGNGAASPSPKSNRKASISDGQVKGTSSPNAEKSGLDLDNSFSTIEFSEDDLLDDLLRETESVYSAPNASDNRISGQKQGQDRPTESVPPKLPEHEEGHMPSPKKLKKLPGQSQTLGPSESLTSSSHVVPTLGPTSDAVVKTPCRSSTAGQAKRVTPPQPVVPPALSARKSQPTAPSSRSFRHPKMPMAPPPPAPPKFRPSHQTPVNHPRVPQFLKPPLPSPRTPTGRPYRSRITKPEQVPENMPPPSTQLFILSHLDDFLPSPSQEVREIFEEPPREKHIGDEAQRTSINTARKPPKPSSHYSKTSTASYNRSATPTLSANPAGSSHMQQIPKHPETRAVAPQPFVKPMPQNTATAYDMPFFSTQDILLSSQDVKDIEEDSQPAPIAHPPASTPPEDCAKSKKPQERPRRSPKPFFTSSFSEMRYKYLMERSRTAAWEGPSARQKAREELDKLQALEDERLAALLAQPNDEEEAEKEKEQEGIDNTAGSSAAKPEITRKASPKPQLQSTPTPQVQASPPAGLHSSGRSARSSIPSSGSIPDGAVPNRTSSSHRPQPSKSGSNSNNSKISQRPPPTRPKSSYDAMLELLAAKGSAPPLPPPGEKQKPTDAAPNGGKGGSRTEYTEENNREKISEITGDPCGARTANMNIPSASQETDYDCGEEWDDDDLLCDML